MLITIIIVCLNCKPVIEETVLSVLDQNYKNFEVIIVDGGSSDGTIEIIEHLRNKDERINFISEKDNGIYDAMNKGIRLSKGEYICFLNSGDFFYSNNVLKKVVENINSTTEILYGDFHSIDENSREFVSNKELILNKFSFLKGTSICHQVIFAKSSILKQNNFDTCYKICADKDWIIKSYKSRYKFKHIEEVIVNYRKNGISTLSENKYTMYLETKEILCSNFLLIGNLYYLLKDIKNIISYIFKGDHNK